MVNAIIDVALSSKKILRRKTFPEPIILRDSLFTRRRKPDKK